ncbi:hypothetical protein MRX96_030002 [Rhipicephalus microplus]
MMESHTSSVVCRLPGGHWNSLELCRAQSCSRQSWEVTSTAIMLRCWFMVHPDRSNSRAQQSAWVMVSLGQFQNGPPAEAGR